jgi:hypothetical protein
MDEQTVTFTVRDRNKSGNGTKTVTMKGVEFMAVFDSSHLLGRILDYNSKETDEIP